MPMQDWFSTLRRSEPDPLDASNVFESLSDLHEYLESEAYINWDPNKLWGLPYNGQIVSVLNGTNEPEVYVIFVVPSGTSGAIDNPLTSLSYLYAPIGTGGGGSTDDGTW